MRATVLAYHAVGECPPEHDPHALYLSTRAFARQMHYLARRRHVVALEDIVEGTFRGHRPAVAITFDDAYRSVMNNAFPILERYGFPATIFVPTRYVGGRNTWLKRSACDFDIMSEEELRSAHQRGISIESHGHSHMDHGAVSLEESARDLETAAASLQRLTGKRPRYLAYPFGSLSAVAEEAALAAGLEAAFTIDAAHRGLYSFGRVPIQPQDGSLTFALKTSGYWLRVRRGGAGPLLRTMLEPLIRRTRRR